MKKTLPLILATVVALALSVATPASAHNDGHDDKAHKVWVCKYVGKPHQDERLKSGKNPIEVDDDAIEGDDDDVKVGDYFSDAHGFSIVVQIGGKDPGVKVCPGYKDDSTTTSTTAASTTTTLVVDDSTTTSVVDDSTTTSTIVDDSTTTSSMPESTTTTVPGSTTTSTTVVSTTTTTTDISTPPTTSVPDGSIPVAGLDVGYLLVLAAALIFFGGAFVLVRRFVG